MMTFNNVDVLINTMQLYVCKKQHKNLIILLVLLPFLSKSLRLITQSTQSNFIASNSNSVVSNSITLYKSLVIEYRALSVLTFIYWFPPDDAYRRHYLTIINYVSGGTSFKLGRL